MAKRCAVAVGALGLWLGASVAVAQCRWQPAATNGTTAFFSVVWAGSRFVGVGWDGTENVVATSPDGVAWAVTARDVPPGRLAWNGSELLGVFSPSAWTSTDAVGWTQITTDLGALQPQLFTSAGGRFFAWVPPLWWGAGSFYTSADGGRWSYLDSEKVNGIVFTGSQYVAVGDSSTGTSPDGLSWSWAPLPAAGGGFDGLNEVAWNGRFLVAVGQNGAVETSPDGTTWTSRTSGVSAELNAVAVTPDGFICGGAQGTVLTSQDGVTWRPEAAPLTNWVYHLVGAGSRTLAVDSYGNTFVRSCLATPRVRRHLAPGD
jgi:hypothetical protein